MYIVWYGTVGGAGIWPTVSGTAGATGRSGVCFRIMSRKRISARSRSVWDTMVSCSLMEPWQYPKGEISKLSAQTLIIDNLYNKYH